MSRPDDHYETRIKSISRNDPPLQPRIGPQGWARWVWRQITSMRTALLLLLLLALAAIPGSLVPQRSSDPNGVAQYFRENAAAAAWLDSVQAFDVYTSVWFSSIYLLLFVSLIGCVIPRTRHHLTSMLERPPRTPARLSKLPHYIHATHRSSTDAEERLRAATQLLRRHRYRIQSYPSPGGRSISAERGYLRETGNLIFHASLVGVLISVGIGGGFGYTGQRVVVEGQSFVNSLANYDSFNPGQFFNPAELEPYSLSLKTFAVTYEQSRVAALGQPLDYTATVETRRQNSNAESTEAIKVNEPLTISGNQIYLLGNGYAPVITITDPSGNVTFSDPVPFLPQDSNLTSLGIVKLPDGLPEQVGLIGFFYPTQATSTTGSFYSTYPDLEYPVLTMNVYTGDLGLDNGIPKSVYSLDTTTLTQITGGTTGVKSIELRPGQSQALPEGLGSISFESIKRFASFEVHHDPAQGWVLVFTILSLTGLLFGLFVPRRRIWVKNTIGPAGTLIEYAGLARGDDPQLQKVLNNIATQSGGQAEKQRNGEQP